MDWTRTGVHDVRQDTTYCVSESTPKVTITYQETKYHGNTDLIADI